MPGLFGNAISKMVSYITLKGEKNSLTAAVTKENTHIQAIKEPDTIKLLVGKEKVRSELLLHTEELRKWLSLIAITGPQTAPPQIIVTMKDSLEKFLISTDRRFYQSILSTLTLANVFLTAYAMLDTVANPDRYAQDSAWEMLENGLKMTGVSLSAIASLEVAAVASQYTEAAPATQQFLKHAILATHALAGLNFGILEGYATTTAWSLLAKVGKGLCAAGVIESSIHLYKLKRFFVQKNAIAEITLESIPALKSSTPKCQ